MRHKKLLSGKTLMKTDLLKKTLSHSFALAVSKFAVVATESRGSPFEGFLNALCNPMDYEEPRAFETPNIS